MITHNHKPLDQIQIQSYEAVFPKQFFSDTTNGRWAGFTPKEQEWIHQITTRSLFGMWAVRWWRSTTKRWVEIVTQYAYTFLKLYVVHYVMGWVRFKKPELLFFTTAGQCCTSLSRTGKAQLPCIPNPPCVPLLLKKGGVLCLFSDFPMQLNMALFEFNGRTGYLLKHDVIRRGDKKFDPFCDRIDTVVASTLTIKAGSQKFSQFLSVRPCLCSAQGSYYAN